MTRWLAAALLLLSPIGLTASKAEAQIFNPYAEPYHNWNQQFPGYSRGGGIYRGQVRDLNPYGDQYRSIQKERRETHRWLGID